MNLRISTVVKAPISVVSHNFNQKLFLALNPPFPPVKLLHFGGSRTGDRVALQLNFFLFSQKWVSDITHHYRTEQKTGFVDEGVTLPFFLKSWKHHHQLVKLSENKTAIIDEITFKTGFLLTDVFMLPLMYAQFLYRKPVYRSFFRKLAVVNNN